MNTCSLRSDFFFSFSSPCFNRNSIELLTCLPERTAARTQIQEICKHIYASARQNKSIADYAKICNLSESRFSHLFHEITGTSPKQYILNAKIEIAKELLKNTELSVAQVGEQIGFSDQNYFSRIFKKNVFLSPSAYRLVQKKGL